MTQTKTAIYETRAAAETAHDGLIALGISEYDISLHSTDGSGRSSSSGSEDKASGRA